MQVLMIGMDGVKSETFQRGWTPYIRSLIEEGDRLQLKEDLVSRGWSEIVLGKHAFYTGAVYEGPLADGTLTWSDKFKMSDVPRLGDEIKPIWQVLNERGYRVGIMNVPTTFPAPEVDGFFISGGGGGGPVSQHVSAEQCHPKGLESRLNDSGYILDERFPTLLDEQGLYEPAAFFNRLDVMNERRTNTFIQLAQEHKIHFGFVVYRSPVTTETILPPELEKKASGVGTVNEDFISAAEDFYRKLDRHIQSLVASFPDAKLLLVSDHSMSTRHYAVNGNAFLVETGFQTHSSGKQQLFRTVKSIKHLIPSWLKKRLKANSNIKSAYESMVTFDAKNTSAFCQAFSNGAHGIYINDRARFGGPVDPEEVVSLSKQIVKYFNDHPESKKHGFSAYLKPMQGDEPTMKKFPDIILDLPDGYHTSNLFPDFVHKTELPRTPFNLREMHKDPRTVGKAHEPLAVCVKEKWQLNNCSTDNLTVVYHHLTQVFP